jgi:hypothetical protein
MRKARQEGLSQLYLINHFTDHLGTLVHKSIQLKKAPKPVSLGAISGAM